MSPREADGALGKGLMDHFCRFSSLTSESSARDFVTLPIGGFFELI